MTPSSAVSETTPSPAEQETTSSSAAMNSPPNPPRALARMTPSSAVSETTPSPAEQEMTSSSAAMSWRFRAFREVMMMSLVAGTVTTPYSVEKVQIVSVETRGTIQLSAASARTRSLVVQGMTLSSAGTEMTYLLVKRESTSSRGALASTVWLRSVISISP